MKQRKQNMNVKMILTLFLATGVLHVSGFDDLDALVRERITNPDADTQDLTWLTPDLRTKIIQRLKSRLQDPDRSENAAEALLTLGDEETADRLIQQYHEGDDRAGRSLERSARESVVAKLIQDVADKTMPKIVEGSDLIPASRRRLSTGIILSGIKQSPVFPERTRLWASHAKDMLQVGFPPAQEKVYSQTQEWWSKNKEAVLARRYENASWVPLEKISIPVTTSMASPQDPKRVWPAKRADNPTPSHDSDRTMPGVSGPVTIVGKQEGSARLPGGWALWAGIAAVLAAAAGGLFLHGRGSRREP